jgi:hypothetical protein
VHESSVSGIKLVNDKTGERVMIRKVLAGLCAFSLIYSCSREDDGLPVIDPVRESDGVVAAFVPKVTKKDWVVSDSTGTDRPDTRAWNTDWSNGDKIGFYMIKKSVLYDLNNALYKNKQYVVDTSSGAVTPVSTAHQMYYPINDDHVQFIAYSPYRPADTAHEVEYTFADQHTEALKQGVDFLFRKETSDDYHKTLSTPVALSFDHQFSKVYIRLLQGNSGLSCLNATAKLTGMPASAKVNLATLAVNANDLNAAITRGAIGDITPQRSSSSATVAVFEAIVPPHTGTAYTSRTFKFTVEGEVYTHTLPNTFDFVSGKAYGFELTLKGRGAPLDMSDDDGLSNCYMVAPGTTSAAISIKRAVTVGGMNVLTTNANITLEPLWDDGAVIQSINPLTPATGDNRTFTVAVANHQGNAVIALKVGGKIYWSWHIWVTDYNNQTYTDNGVTIMDRNLGATDNTYTNASFGLYYQWGRKDPFPGAVSGSPGYGERNKFHGISDSSDPGPYTITSTGAIQNKLGVMTSIQNPTTFYSTGSSWLPSHVLTLWSATGGRSVYDPCPDGYITPYIYNTLWYQIRNNNITIYKTGNKILGIKYKDKYISLKSGFRLGNGGTYQEEYIINAGALYLRGMIWSRGNAGGHNACTIYCDDDDWEASDFWAGYYMGFNDSYALPIRCQPTN